MGQYYRALLIFDDGTVRVGNPHDFGSGSKLMESAWVGNEFVNAVLGQIEDRPARVVWMGDYADDDDMVRGEIVNLGGGMITGFNDFKTFFTGVWDYKYKLIESDCKKILFDIKNPDLYAVNLTKNWYIDLEKYVSECATMTPYGESCVNPIPILTSIGNGLGGGDYHGCNREEAGTWAFDRIYITALKPNTMKEVHYSFVE